MSQHKTLESIQQNYPQAKIIKKMNDYFVIQKCPGEPDYYIVPKLMVKDYDSFRNNDAHRFLKFMRILGELRTQFNKVSSLQGKGLFVADINAAETNIVGYAAKIYFQKQEQKSFETLQNVMQQHLRV